MFITNDFTSYPYSAVAPSSNTKLSIKLVAICGMFWKPSSSHVKFQGQAKQSCFTSVHLWIED